MRQNTLTSLIKVGVCTIFALGFLAQSQAADASGKWTWTRPGRNGGPDQVSTLTLKVDGTKLTGNLSSPGRGGAATETAISECKIAGDEISFSVVREVQGNKMTTKYNGKVTADTIKGKIEFDRNGETQSRDWEAKKETKKD